MDNENTMQGMEPALDADDADMEDADISDVDVDPDEDFDPDEDLEYDENGDIVIPDDEDADEEDDADEEADGKKETAASAPARQSEEASVHPAAMEAERLRRELIEHKAVASAALRGLGMKGENPTEEMIRLAAEAEGVSPEIYKQRMAVARHNAEARRFLQASEFEKKMAADLAAVQAEYPETAKYGSVKDFPNFRRFAQMRDAGLSPEEAYIASHSKEATSAVARKAGERAAATAKQKSLNGTKSHLRSNVPKGTKGESFTMSRRELQEYRELFPGKSDKEIAALYRQTMKK